MMYGPTLNVYCTALTQTIVSQKLDALVPEQNLKPSARVGLVVADKGVKTRTRLGGFGLTWSYARNLGWSWLNSLFVPERNQVTKSGVTGHDFGLTWTWTWIGLISIFVLN